MDKDRATQFRSWQRRFICLLWVVMLCTHLPSSYSQQPPAVPAGANTSPAQQTPLSSADEVLPTPVPAAPLPGSTLEPRQHFLPLQTPASDVVVNGDGGLISLAVRDAPLRQVLALIAETQKLNIVFATPTTATVTASFERVPWQKAFEALMSISGHTWTMSDDIIFVSGIGEADKVSPNAGGRITQVFELDFVSAADAEQAVAGLLSEAGKSWIMESSTNDNRRTRESVAVVDYPANLVRIGDYIDQIDQPPRQVFIEAHILQVDLNDECKNGVNFQQLVNTLELGTVGFVSNVEPFSGNNATGFFLDLERTGGGLAGVIELLQTTMDAKTLASPKIHAVSGQESQIQIGEKLPYRNLTTTQTATMENVQFLDVGVVLSVTPRVSRDGRVLMKILPKVSTGAFIPGGESGPLPEEKTTELETDVLLSSGQGMILGGLIQEELRNTQSKIPWLGDIPYVGILFQRREIKKERKEIIIAIVPHVLPYQPIMAQKQAHALMRAGEPLTHGALCVWPRPYEAAMPDTCTNPTPVVRNAMRATYNHMMHHNTVPQPLPLIDADDSYLIFDEQQFPEIQFPSDLYAPLVHEEG